MKTPMQFRNEVLGKTINMDGMYGAQCWDGYAYYMKWLNYPYAYCTTSGYAKDLWNDRATNGMLNTCDEVFVMQPGDIAVFKQSKWTPTSHVAIFMKDLGNEFGLFLGENQGSFTGFSEIRLPYSATYITAFRPKYYKNQTVQGNTNNTQAQNQMIQKGSLVQFGKKLRVESYNAKTKLIYNSRVGGWIDPSICTEDSANDGALDQYFANTNATFSIPGTFHVRDVQKRNGQWDAYIEELKFWVHANVLTKI